MADKGRGAGLLNSAIYIYIYIYIYIINLHQRSTRGRWWPSATYIATSPPPLPNGLSGSATGVISISISIIINCQNHWKPFQYYSKNWSCPNSSASQLVYHSRHTNFCFISSEKSHIAHSPANSIGSNPVRRPIGLFILSFFLRQSSIYGMLCIKYSLLL